MLWWLGNITSQERKFLSFLNTSHWLCPFAVTIVESWHDKDWDWHTPNFACPGASLDDSATVTSSSIIPGRSVPVPMTPVRNFQMCAHFFILIACPDRTRKGWHLGWGRKGQCLLQLSVWVFSQHITVQTQSPPHLGVHAVVTWFEDNVGERELGHISLEDDALWVN